jgi:hypothetical protein
MASAVAAPGRETEWKQEAGMAVGAGPTVRQRQLGMRLRTIRREKNLSVEAVASELECSLSKITRLETATRRPNPRDVRDLCKFYGLDEAPPSGQFVIGVKQGDFDGIG